MRFNRCKRYHFIILAKTIFTEDITKLNTKLIRVSFMYITTIYYEAQKFEIRAVDNFKDSKFPRANYQTNSWETY